VHFIVASCENMVHGKAMRPGDVLTAANGKTVEARALLHPTTSAAPRTVL
jgi:leucyl aminopeptidase